MFAYEVEGPETAKAPLWQTLCAILGGLLLMVLVYRAFALVPVSIDGKWLRVPSGSSVEYLVERGYGRSKPGDLLSARTRRVLKQGGGMEPTVWMNGEQVAPEKRLYSMDSVETRDGADTLEPVKVTYETLIAPMKVEGSGPMLKALRDGVDGMKRVSRGEISHEIAEETVITAPKAALYVRSPISAKGKVVALTFDDGPWPGSTAAILNVLKAENVKATFFVIGRQVPVWPNLVRREVREGHAVGNHTFNHKKLGQIGVKAAHGDIINAQRVIRGVTGSNPVLLRPPGGSVNTGIYREARKEGLTVVLWTVDPQDWTRGRTWWQVANGVVSAVKPGSVVLLHDGGGDRRPTVKALRNIIVRLRRKGYTFVLLQDLPAIRHAINTGKPVGR